MMAMYKYSGRLTIRRAHNRGCHAANGTGPYVDNRALSRRYARELTRSPWPSAPHRKNVPLCLRSGDPGAGLRSTLLHAKPGREGRPGDQFGLSQGRPVPPLLPVVTTTAQGELTVTGPGRAGVSPGCWPPFLLSVKSASGVIAGEGHLRRCGTGRATTP